MKSANSLSRISGCDAIPLLILPKTNSRKSISDLKLFALFIRETFLKLSTNEEREQFIENFWLRRDPTPDTPENEFKEEHFRRIAYANEHFASGAPGWKTDRGRIYIIWGKPDNTDTHPSGGNYNRTPEEGGGNTETYPFEDWTYNYLEGIGPNVKIEFVDKSGTNEYRLSTDPGEKDALLYVPGAGLSELEQYGLADKTQRFKIGRASCRERV